MPQFEYLKALAEAVSPLSHSLAAGLLIRPSAARFESALSREELEEVTKQTPLENVCLDLDALLKSAVPAINQALEELGSSAVDELDELVDELAAPSLELVDMARRIWATPLQLEAEAVRPLLATLAEAPVTQLLQLILEIMHTVIDPYAVAEDPASPKLSYTLIVPDAPIRKSLAKWRANNPGFIPEEVLR